MKLLGSLTDTIKAIFKKDGQDITIQPNSSTTFTTSQTVDLPPPDGDNADVLVGEDATQTLTNKTIDGDDNTIQDLALTSLKTTLSTDVFIQRDSGGVVIDSTKAVPGGAVVGTTDSQTLTNKIIAAGANTISGLTHGSEVDNPTTGVHGVTGNVVGTSDTQTLTNKTIVAGSNTISGLLHGTHVDEPSSGVHGVTGTIVGTSDTQILTNKTIDADLNTVSNIADAEIKAGAAIDASKIADGSVSSTEFQYLGGVTSDVQTQLDDKVSLSAVGTQTLSGAISLAGNELQSAVLDDVAFSVLSGQTSSNAFDVAGGEVLVRFSTVTADLQTVAIQGATPVAGQLLLISNDNASASLTIAHETGATAAQQFSFSDAQDLLLGANTSAIFVYDAGASKWKLTGGAGSGSGASLGVVFPTANVTSVSSGTTYAFDTGTAARSITLPALSATDDTVIWVSDLDGNASVNNITIDATTNSQTIDGLASGEDFVIDLDGGWVKLSRDANTSTWSLETPGVLGASILDTANTWTGSNDFTGGLQIGGLDVGYSQYNVALNGSFTGGTLRVVRLGTLVNISLVNANYAGSIATPSSASGLLPAEFRPAASLRLWGFQEGGYLRSIRVLTDGTVQIANIDATFSGAAIVAPSADTLMASYHIY